MFGQIAQSSFGLLVDIGGGGFMGSVSDVEVTSLRHALAEFDADENGRLISKEIQYALLLRSCLPIAALIDSGGKSLHAIVRIDAPDRTE
jgi:regulatory protein RepA